MPTDEELNQLTEQIIGGAIRVHQALGPGLLESAYRQCLAYELRKSGLKTAEEVEQKIVYDDIAFDVGYRMDLVVEETVVLELKAVESITNVHKAQLLSYLKLSQIPLGLLINFNVTKLVSGITRLRI